MDDGSEPIRTEDGSATVSEDAAERALEDRARSENRTDEYEKRMAAELLAATLCTPLQRNC